MEKFIQPRGSGRTYNICKYAIRYDCDIISPNSASVIHCVNTIRSICQDSNKYIVTDFSVYSPGFVTLRSVEDKNKTKLIKVYTPVSYGLLKEEERTRHIVIDDIDLCLSSLLNVRWVDAISISTDGPVQNNFYGNIGDLDKDTVQKLFECISNCSIDTMPDNEAVAAEEVKSIAQNYFSEQYIITPFGKARLL